MVCLIASCLLLSGCGEQNSRQAAGQIIEQDNGSGGDTELAQTEGTEKTEAEETAAETEKPVV